MIKKEVLFWTFMSIYIAVAIISMGVLTGFMQVNAEFQNWLLAVFLTQSVGAVVAVFHKVNFFGEIKIDKSEQVQPYPRIETDPITIKASVETSTSESAINEEGPASAEEYFEMLDKLSDRFAEKANYIERVRGTMITWVCVVVESSKSYGGKGTIWLRTRDKDIANVIYLEVTRSCLTRALALQKGDYIRFTSHLDNGIWCAPHLKVDDFELVCKEEWALPKIGSNQGRVPGSGCVEQVGDRHT